MTQKIIAFLLLVFLLAKTPDTFGMQKPLDEQQLNAIVQNFKTAVDEAKPYNLLAETTRDVVIITSGAALMIVSRKLLKFILIRLAQKARPEAYIMLGSLVSLGAAVAIKGLYDLCTINTTYTAIRQVTHAYPPFILKQLLAHPDLQDDTTQQALKDALITKTKK